MTEEKKKKIKKIYNVISTVILAVVFVFLIVVVAVTVMQKRQNQDTEIFGHYVYVVATDSMTPTIAVGDAIWCEKATADNVKVGSVVTFTAPGGVTQGYNETHRIVRIETGDDGVERIYTKGDNPTASEDRWSLSRSDVKSVYVKTLPVISGLMRFIINYNFLAYIVLIALPLLIVGILFIVGYVQDRVKAERASVPAAATSEAPLPGGASLDDLSEEEKQKLLDEFLLSRKNAESGADGADSAEKSEQAPGNGENPQDSEPSDPQNGARPEN